MVLTFSTRTFQICWMASLISVLFDSGATRKGKVGERSAGLAIVELPNLDNAFSWGCSGRLNAPSPAPRQSKRFQNRHGVLGLRLVEGQVLYDRHLAGLRRIAQRGAKRGPLH